MELQKANTVYKTEDYEMFKKMKHNRYVREQHVQKLKKSMKERYYHIPLVVTKDFEIADGQNRFEAIKSLGLPVYFIVLENITVKDVKKMNMNQEGWSRKEWAESYKSEGLTNYVYYLNIRKEFKVSHTVALALLANHTDDIIMLRDLFVQGSLFVEDYELARKTAIKLRACRETFKGWRKANFVYPMIYLLKQTPKKYDHERFLAKLKVAPTLLINELSLSQRKTDIINAIEKIYNHRVVTGAKVRLPVDW
tara:strand:+ start:110 stop:865 length:756 start_codon:yes stop_codon:yes gene_type:complete